MDNYIIFNGVDSRTINGIIISELPPIIKPAKRCSLEEIDGRDGDNITVQGYKAFDISIEIGLTKNYDIDMIIDWLNSSGKLVLSTDPGKYYNATVLEQIDFKKLLRFRTATIKFHVQPFKYYLDEKKDVLEISSETSLTVYSKGNYKSNPIISLEGSGVVEVAIDGITAFKYTFPANETEVVIDGEQQDAYLNEIYKNRNMIGKFPILTPGKHVISWSGSLTKITVNPCSRWI